MEDQRFKLYIHTISKFDYGGIMTHYVLSYSYDKLVLVIYFYGHLFFWINWKRTLYELGH